MNKREYNFIVAKLGDNDFGYIIKKALSEGVDYFGADKKLCPILWKCFIIEYLIGYLTKQNIVREGRILSDEEVLHYRSYFSKLRVTFERHSPVDDHDGGSACYDLNLNNSFTF